MTTITRFVFLTHRYVGIGIGLLIAAWCLSGVVMMYVGFPDLGAEERRQGLAPLTPDHCCRLPEALVPADTPVAGFRVESRAGRPVALVDMAGGGVIDLATGQRSPGIDEDTAFAVASEFAARTGIVGGVAAISQIERDQWTVNGSFDRYRPLYKATLNDAAGTEIYVSGATGEVVQKTTRHERFWNWFGAVVHWIYPTMLRQHTELWAQVIIWTSVIGTFLTVTGMYAGIRQFRRGKRRAVSPYRGFSFWHHVGGLVFGILMLTWVVSGLFSMTPWGLFQRAGVADERRTLAGEPPRWDAVKTLIAALPARLAARDVVAYESAYFGGVPYLMEYGADGAVQRVDPRSLRPAPLDAAELEAAARALRPDASVRSVTWLEDGDAYYFAHHDPVKLPVLRVTYGDAEDTRYYLDPDSGQLLRKVDSNARLYRWLHHGLHRLDFTAWLRARPVWDIVVLPLMLGVSALALTGCWLGVKRLRRG